MKITQIPWKVEPHTIVKHEILKRYLQAWMPILARSNGRIIYFDGFAGPGEYLDGKGNKIEGSPIIAIRCFLEHSLKNNLKEVRFIFIEKSLQVFEHLTNLLKPYEPQVKLEIYNDEFNKVIIEGLDKLKKEGTTLAPTFCFIDPFGFKGLPLSTVSRIMSNKRCEVLINFMYEDIIRFMGLQQNGSNINLLFGETEQWQRISKLKDSKEKYFALTSLYESQLRNICKIKYIRTFMMKNQFNKEDYVLFFCTNNPLGLIKMKESMWRIDETGNFTFSDATYNPHQTLLFEKKPNYAILKKLIVERYKNRTISMEELIEFVNLETAFLEVHLRKPILAPMESNQEIEVKNRTRLGSYPPKSLITFK